MAESQISLKEKASFGIGAVGKDAACAIIYIYLMIYFTDVVGVSAAFVGVIFLIARLWDAINDPIMGWIVDNTKTRWGKFRPWILIGTIVNSIIVLFLFYNPAQFLGETGVMIYCAVFYILWGMSYTMMDIPYWSMIPSFSSDSKVRDVMSVIPRTCAMFGNQFVAIFGLSIIALLGTGMGGTESDGFFRYTVLIVVIFLIAEIICVRNVREHVQTPLRQKITFSGMLKILVRNDQLLVIIVLTVIQQLAQNLINGSILYYFRYALMNEDVYPIFMAVGACMQFVAFLLFPKLVSATSRRFVYILSALLMVAGYMGLFFFGSTKDAYIPVAIAFYGTACVGVALSLVTTTVMLADTVDYGEYKLGTRSESIVFSMQTMTVKFGTALAGFMTGMTLTVVGYVPNVEQTAETLFGLRLVMFAASSVMVLVMLLIYMRCYKLNGDFYKNMLSALQISRSQAAAQKERMFLVNNAMDPRAVLLDVTARNKEELIETMVSSLDKAGLISDRAAVLRAVLHRENEAPTGIAYGIALPHAKSEGVQKPVIAVARLRRAVDFGAPDGLDCDLVFLIAAPADADAYLDLAGRLSLILNDRENVEHLRQADSPEALVHSIRIAEKKLGDPLAELAVD